MPTYAEAQRQAYSRSAGGSQPFNVAPQSTGDLVAPSQNQSLSRPGTYRPRNLLPGENPNTPSSYQAPAQGTKSVPYNTIDVPATRVDTPNNQLSGSKPTGTLSGSGSAGSLPASGQSGGSSPGSRFQGMTGNNANPSIGNGSRPNHQPKGISGAGGAGVLRPLAPLSKLAGKALPLLPLLDDWLFPSPGNAGEDEFLKKNAGRLKPDPKLNGEKASPNLKGNGYPNLPQPKQLGNFANGQTFGTWNLSFTYTYKVDGENIPANIDGGNHNGKVLSVYQAKEGIYTVVYAVMRNSPESWDVRTVRVGVGGFQNAPAENVKPRVAPVGKTPGKEDEQQEEAPAVQRNPDFAPDYNNDPTLQPANPPNAERMPDGNKSPQLAPPKQPQKDPTKDKEPNPLDPFLPLLPLLPLLPTLPGLRPPGSPSPAPNASPTGSPSGSPSALPGGGSATGAPLKAPQTGDKPGDFPDPNPKPEKKTFTPNLDPTESGKCCKSQGADLDELKRILGVKEFPATLPLLSGGQTRLINNIPDLLLWNSSNVDSVAGYFPAKVTVVQGDSSEKSFELKNIGHAFEELFGALLLVAQDADAGVNISARTATEVIQTKIAVQQGNQLLTAIQKFLGFTVKPVARILKLNFSPNADGIDNKLANAEMANFLKPSTTTYVGSEIAEKKEALPLLERILQNTEIVRMAHWHPLKPDKAGKDNITGSRIAEKKGKPSAAEVKQWEEYLKILKDAGYIVDDNSPKKDSK